MKILYKYCGSISILSSICFLFSFSAPHTYTHISHPLLFFFSTFQLIPEPPSLFLSLALSFSTLFLFFFYHYLQIHTNRHKEKGGIALAPPHCHRCSSSSPPLLHHTHTSLFFFLIFYCCSIFFFCSWSVLVVVLILDLLFKLNQFFMRARYRTYWRCS